MKFKYRVIWTNISKNRQEWCDIDSQGIALFIAKKKVSDGMRDVLIQVTGDSSIQSDPDDASWPAIDATINEAENKII